MIAISLFVGGAAGFSVPAIAQTPADSSASSAAFPDTPQNHWAYEAVQDLANKGLVKGYPDGKFLGNRSLSRYEFATVIDRLLQTIQDMKAAPEPAAVAPQVTQDDLNKIQVLVDTFQTQLNAIQDNVTQAQADIEALRQDVLDTKALANKAQATANASYGSGSNRKFSISGYIQARYLAADAGSYARFPNGAPAANSPFNGNYMQNGDRTSINVRRARIKFTGQVTPNTKYAIQLDVSGVANPAISTVDSSATGTSGVLSTSATAVSVREANFGYTFGDGSASQPTLTVGQFSNPFGYELSLSSASILSPERPLAFNEGGNGLFNTDDYIRGAQISYGPGSIHFTAAVANGNGFASTNTDRKFDQIYRLNYLSRNKVYGIGVSYDNGDVATANNTTSTTAPIPYLEGKRQLTGVDAQITLPSGPFVNAEYVSGPFEQLSYFTASSNNVKTTTTRSLGNKVEGYYAAAGYTFKPTGNHPLTLVYMYDVFKRSSSGPVSNSSYDDVNNGYGILYNLDKATRVRFWYEDPTKVAHAPGTTDPPKIGLFTTELQVKF